MPCSILVDPLQCDLLHLAYGTTVIRHNLALVDFANNEGRGRNSGMCVHKDDFRPVCHWLRD